MNLQFLGYIAVDDRRDVLQQSGIPLEASAVTQEERGTLLSAHRALVDLNRKCVESLTRSLPYERHVDPYSLHASHFDEAVPALELYDHSAADAVVDAFTSHPAFRVVRDTFRLFSARPVTDEFYNRMLEAVVNWDRELEAAGPMEPPVEARDIWMREAPTSPRRVAYRHVTALLSLRSSMANMNQLVYQAVVSDRLPMLNEDNLITVGPVKGHIAGQGMSAVYQPGNAAGFLDPGWLLLFHMPFKNSEVDDLWRLQRLEVHFSQDTGTEVKVQLSGVDDGLNCYGTLLRQL